MSNDTLARVEAIPAPTQTRMARVKDAARSRAFRVFAALAVFFAAPVAFASGAQASPPEVDDPTGGAASDMVGSVTDWITTYGAPVIFGLLLLGIIIRVAVKYVRKGASSV